MARRETKSFFWAISITVVVLDFITKRMAVAGLSRLPVPVVGDFMTFHLVYNPGAAFGINFGQYSRWIFMTLAIVALFVLGAMVRGTPPSDKWKISSLALICGGAVGNLIDRFTNSRGVVDFIDVGIGSYRWPTFNIADMAVSCGAVILAVILWREGKEEEAARASES